MITRNIYINSKQVCAPIHIVYGTSNQQIQFCMKDVTLASGNAATFYCLAPNNQRYSAAGTIDTSAGTITFTPAAGFFVTGNNLLQCEITQSSKKLHNFAVDVICELNVQSAGTVSEPVDVASYTARAETAATNAAASEAAAETYLNNMAAAFPAVSASGNLITIPDGADGIPVKSMVVNIEPVQAGSGDPSPTNVRTISGWTAIRVRRAGKNILQRQNTGSSSSNGVSFVINADGSVTASGTASANAFTNYGYTYNILKLPKGVQLRVSGGDSSVSVRIYYMEEGTTASQMLATSASGSSTFTVPDNAGTVWARIFVLSGTVISDPITVYPMVTVADNDTEYEEYQGDVYVVSTDDAGTVYGGTLDVTNGVLTVTEELKTYTGSFNWQTWSSQNGYYLAGVMSENQNGYPSKCTWLKTLSAYNSGEMGVCVGINNTRLYVAQVNNNITGVTDLESWKTYLNNNPLVITIPVTPQTYQLTATQVTTLLGLNNIWADTGSTELTYRADPALYVERRLKATRNIIAGVEDSMTATKNYTTGQYLICGDNLYKVTANIANGGAITVGTNVSKTTVAEQLILALS